MHLLVSTKIVTNATDLPSSGFSCGLDATLRVIAGKWKPLIIYFLVLGPNRYGALKRAVRGVSDKVLIQQLKELERDGIVHREVHEQVPPKVVYSLTDLGVGLNAALAPLGDWGEAHLDHITSVREATAAGC